MLSFIVPAYNEERELAGTLEAIRHAAQSVSEEYEIIVVDDASTDATAEIAARCGARVVRIERRQIAAARNAGAKAAQGDVLFFVDADTRVSPVHICGALDSLRAGNSGGSARVAVDGNIPLWANIFIRLFCLFYFANNLGAGAFLFTTRNNFEAVGRFDEQLFIGEEVYLSLALKRLGRFKILPQPILTSGRKLRMYPARQILWRSLCIIMQGKRAVRSRDHLEIWYEGRREAVAHDN